MRLAAVGRSSRAELVSPCFEAFLVSWFGNLVSCWEVVEGFRISY